MEIYKEYRFEAAHRLPNVPPEHKCFRLHGHSFRFEIHVRGKVDPKLGWLIDFGDIDSLVEPIRSQLDHHYLNEIEGLSNPTSETLVKWLWNRLAKDLPLSAVVVSETCDSGCVYRGEDE